MEIIATILRTAGNGTTKTKIMYESYLSFTQIKEYLSFLEKLDLIELDEVNKKYKTTAKGVYFLRIFDELNQLLEITETEKTIT